MFIEWNDDLSVGLQEIDRQHLQIVDIINSLHEATIRSAGKKEMLSLLNQLSGYTAYHFGTEETYFVRFKYEEAQEHIEDHKRLLAHIQSFIDRYEADIKVSVGELIYFIGDWLTNHLRGMDQQYVACFMGHGVK